MTSAVIVSAARTAVGKAPRGALRTTRPEEMAAAVIGAVVERAPAVDPREIDDVIMGCAMPEAEQGMNVARIASLRGRPASGGAGADGQPVLFERPADDRPGRAAGDERDGRGRHRRRRRDDVDGADEQQQVHGQPDAGQGSIPASTSAWV